MSHTRCEHIAAGQFKVMEASCHTLQAHLGTCLGVALYDPVKKAGGMIHILLPNPPGFYPPLMPEKYAATGIPMMIRALTDLGCTLSNLKATIAGGALVSPVSPLDIGLNIGGRSAETAQALLKEYGIEIIKYETGGFFTCTLELNMETGKTGIKPAWENTLSTGAPFIPPTDADISETIGALKPIPQTALKILRMFQEGKHGFDEITHELSQDQVLSAQTLKLCNSALFSGTVRVDTLKDAVLLLGRDLLIKTVITAAVEAYYNQTGVSGYSLCKGGLFLHAVGVATLAEQLAKKTGKADVKQAYTAGLLHDIGKVVLDQFVAGSLPLLFRDLTQDPNNFMSFEKEKMGLTHCEAGAILAESWQFSTALTQVVRHHHTPESADAAKELVFIVFLADLLMERFVTGLDLETVDTRSMPLALARLELDSQDLPQLIDTLPLNALIQHQISDNTN